MESSILGVPHMGRSDSNVSGIRAPITLDESDFEYSGSSYYSGSELEGFESGEDIPEKALIVEEDEGFVEETDIVKELAFSDGAVVELNGEVVEGSSGNERKFVQESGNVGGNGVFRPLARFPNGETHKGVGHSDDSGSLLSDSSDDELVKEEKGKRNLVSSRPVVAVVNDEISEGELSPVLSFKVPSARKLAIPVAKISGDSDDDSTGSVVLDEEDFSGVARVPSIEMLDRINSAPKVRILEADEEGDENESQAENVVKMELVENLLANGMALSPSDKTGTIAVETLANSTLESGRNEDLIHLHEDIKEVDVVEDTKECVELVDFGEPADIVEIEGTVLPNISCVSSVVEGEVSEFGGSFDDKDGENNNSGLEDNCISNHDYGSENVESMKQEIEQTVESLSFDADHGISSAHLCVDINEVPAEAVPEYIYDSISEDASSTCAFAAGHTVFKDSKLEQEPGKEAEASDPLPVEVEESSFHSNNEAMIVEMGVVQDSTTPDTGGISLDYMQEIDGQVVKDIHDEVDVDGEMSNGRRSTDPAAVASLFKAVRSAVSEADDIKSVSVDGVDNLSLGSNLNDLGIFDPARATSAGGGTHGVRPSSINVEQGEALSEHEKENIKKIQKIRVRYLCLLEKLGRSSEDSVASKVLHQLTLAAGSSHSLEFHLDSIRNAALELEAQRDNSDFSLSVLIIGKTGVGKSATINSILGEGTAVVDAFEPSTARVKEVTGLINGVKIKIFDTPGLRTSLIDQSINRKILSSIKKVMKRSPPDVILYVDRLDTRRDNFNDLPLLRLVTSFLGSSIWKKSVVAFTHGTSVPPDGPNGFPLSYEAFVAKQFQVIQELICHSIGEPVVMSSGLMIPVCVIENHPFAEKNGSREIVLHDWELWISQLLLLCCSMKILSEVSSVVATRSSSDYEEVFGFQICSPPLSDYLSSFLKTYVHPELSNDQSGDIVGSDVEVCYSSDSNPEKNVEKQSSEEMRRIRNLSRSEVAEQETEAPKSVAVPLPDMALPPSFDGDIPSSRYRVLEHYSCLLTRPILVSPWDHDCNYGSLLIEDKIIIASNCFPALISVQLTKDKKEFEIKLHSSVSARHGDKGSTMAGIDILPSEEKLAYTLKVKTRIKDFRKHRTAAAAFVTFVEENLVSGLKVEDHVPLGKRAALVGNAGVIQSQDDAAYGVILDLCVKGKDLPINEDETSVGMSVMRSRGELIYGCNLHSRISMSSNSKVDITAALNNGLKGRISIKTSSSDQLQIAALALVPTAIAVFKRIFRMANRL